MSITFRHSAGFGRRMEYWLIGQMLREGLDVYVPLVDDFGIDAVVRKQDNQFIEIQIKARSNTVKLGDAALFAAIDHPEPRNNYYFVFYSSDWLRCGLCRLSNSSRRLYRTKPARTLGDGQSGSMA